ncbi:HAD hydrolase-like protein [Paenibacillus sp. Leaf72]|uniref:HAD hydrolase-like protein n=1 Tax=Paenibacillus sp. Leaf72 TaxID=1736234 RepID=UPI0006FC3B72|nr:HAD hydrolase-like protein [Paenibacillus sp. Leaf72]KQO18272.1 hypothetical protein ASF12_06480 [Paenibacillus sp. Leaf72]
MYKHVIFDFDGTIADSAAAVFTIYNEMAAQYRFKPVTEEEYKKLSQLSLQERFKALDVPFYRFMLFRKISKEFKRKYNEHVASIPFCDGMQDVLSHLLQSGIKLSVITSNAANNVADFLQPRGIHTLHDIRSSSGLFGKHKTIQTYLKQNRLRPDDVIYVGDELRDIVASHKCGIKVIGVTWGLDPKELLESGKPSFLIDQPQELLRLIESTSP